MYYSLSFVNTLTDSFDSLFFDIVEAILLHSGFDELADTMSVQDHLIWVQVHRWFYLLAAVCLADGSGVFLCPFGVVFASSGGLDVCLFVFGVLFWVGLVCIVHFSTVLLECFLFILTSVLIFHFLSCILTLCLRPFFFTAFILTHSLHALSIFMLLHLFLSWSFSIIFVAVIRAVIMTMNQAKFIRRVLL